jgi:hypothetical protein
LLQLVLPAVRRIGYSCEGKAMEFHIFSIVWGWWERRVARDIDRKLRLTAALLGTVTRKDLAAAFREANSSTSFDVGRADKWLQGRSQPRELSIYDDWSRVIGLSRPGRWVADCDIDTFIEEICRRHHRDKQELLRQAAGPGSPRGRQAPGMDLAGNFICYSHAWSPYFRGRLVRGELSIVSAGGSGRLTASYKESLPTGPMKLDGTASLSKHDFRLDVRDATGSAQLITFCLFPPSPPASVLGGLMIGTTLIGPEPQPSVTRVIIVRLPSAMPPPGSRDAYLPTQGSIAGDLVAFGLPIREAATLDRSMDEFLNGGGGSFDQVPVSAYRGLVDLFDRIRLADATATDSGDAVPSRTG